jgi:competence protein ComFC
MGKLNSFHLWGKERIQDLIFGFFPPSCVHCSSLLHIGEPYICVVCRNKMAFTHQLTTQSNSIFEKLYPRCPIQGAAAMLYFEQLGVTQSVLHSIKYGGQPGLAQMMGKWMAYRMHLSDIYTDNTCIIPVPLHARKLAKRGFNQSEMIAKGIAERLQTTVETNVLVRAKNHSSLTKKQRWQRWLAISKDYVLNHPEKIKGKHIWLIDDVVTTGATFEICAQTLLSAKPASITCLALAVV